MRTSFTLGASVVLLSLVASGNAQAQCLEPCLENENGTLYSCDAAVNSLGFTCEELETWHCCDCSGCTCGEVETTMSSCDMPCLGDYSANDLIDMIGNSVEECTEAVNDDIAPGCDIEGCCGGLSECQTVQEGCGFSCDDLNEAGFTCEDALVTGCNCTSCGCVPAPTTTEPADCDQPCGHELFDVT